MWAMMTSHSNSKQNNPKTFCLRVLWFFGYLLHSLIIIIIIIMKSFANATNAEAVETEAVALRANVTAVEVEVETVVGEGWMERTRPIVSV